MEGQLEIDVFEYLVDNSQILQEEFLDDNKAFLHTRILYPSEYIPLFNNAYKKFIKSLIIYHLICVFNSNYEIISLILDNEKINMFLEEQFMYV